jgi:hypothetical protein
MNLLLVLLEQGARQHSILLQGVGRTHRWCVGKNFISSICPAQKLGTFDLFFFPPLQNILEALQKRKSNWLGREGRACIHECMVEGNEDFEHMLFFLFTCHEAHL